MSLINKKQNTLTQTIGHSHICIKSTCLICKRFDNNENHIKYNEYYLCKSCFIIKDIHKKCNVLLEDKECEKTIKKIYWVKCKCGHVHEFIIFGNRLLGDMDYGTVICDCQKK